jgi:hypothetical protein
MKRPAAVEQLLDRFFPPERLERTYGYRVELEALVNDDRGPNPRVTIELDDLRGFPGDWELIAVAEAARQLIAAAAPGARIIQDGDFGSHLHLTDAERTLGGWRQP